MKQLLSDFVIEECNSIEEMLDILTKNGEINYSELGNQGQDYRSFISRHKFFKNYIKENLPEFTLEEVLKFYKYYHDYSDVIFKMSGHHYFMSAIEFEQRKGLL